ncbi:MAG TPA: DUF2058 family protein [Stenotrophomonas sp.]
MSDTLRDQLMGLGFKPAPKPERKNDSRPQGRGPQQNRGPQQRGDGQHGNGPQPSRGPRQGQPAQPGHAPSRGPGGRPSADKPSTGAGRPAGSPQGRPGRGPAKPRSREDIDLAKAYAIRAQREKDERIEAERLKQEEARLRREAKTKLEELLKDKALNLPDADIARHFPYGGKIKRIYVSAEQLKLLNAGELGVLQLNGRYVLVTAALLAEAEAVFAPSVALKVDPDAPAEADPYADPLYQVPDDLVW